MLRQELSGKMGLRMKHLRGRRSEMKEMKSAMGTGESGIQPPATHCKANGHLQRGD